jgi:cobalt-zinc-cadmium efflux system outer membrane protein
MMAATSLLNLPKRTIVVAVSICLCGDSTDRQWVGVGRMVKNQLSLKSVGCPATFVMMSLLGFGCQSTRQEALRTSSLQSPASQEQQESALRRVSHTDEEGLDGFATAVADPQEIAVDPQEVPVPIPESLNDLEYFAQQTNPILRRMQHEAEAAWDKSRYVGKLPDPTVGSNFFVPPMNFEPDRQVAELQLMQMLPWLGRLKAEARQACLEALAAENAYQAERLRVVGEVRVNWLKLYVLGKQIETTIADQGQLESLIKTANARIATGNAQPGDVLMATLEMSSLEEQLLSYRQQVVATTAELNRLLGRDATVSIPLPTTVGPELPRWDHALLKQIAFESQPELNAARLRSAAALWGIEVARLKRRPDVTVGAGWVVMDAPGAMMADAGRDSLMLSVSTTLPVSRSKYDAMYSEATRQHMAANASEDEIGIRIDATIRDLWEQALASHQTVELYEKSILPQARQTFEADQKSLVNNTVTFERVIRDYRTLLSLELGYHRALGQQATALARIRQTIGVDLDLSPPAAAELDTP